MPTRKKSYEYFGTEFPPQCKCNRPGNSDIEKEFAPLPHKIKKAGSVKIFVYYDKRIARIEYYESKRDRDRVFNNGELMYTREISITREFMETIYNLRDINGRQASKPIPPSCPW